MTTIFDDNAKKKRKKILSSRAHDSIVSELWIIRVLFAIITNNEQTKKMVPLSRYYCKGQPERKHPKINDGSNFKRLKK